MLSVDLAFCESYTCVKNSSCFRVNSDTLRRRKRDINSTDTNPATTFRLEAHGDSFSFSVVHTRPALHPNGIVLFTSGDTSRIWQGTSQDCFMTGKLTSHDAQTAVFSFCDNLVRICILVFTLFNLVVAPVLVTIVSWYRVCPLSKITCLCKWREMLPYFICHPSQ